MKGLFLNDIYIIWKLNKILLIFLVAYMLIGAVSGNLFFISISVLFAALSSKSIMAWNEQNKYDRYLLTMPYSRKAIVAQRYLSSILITLLTLLFAVVICLVLSFVTDGFALAGTLSMLICMLFAATVFNDINLPLIFKFGCEKSRIYFFIMIILLFAASGAFISEFGENSIIDAGMSISMLALATAATIVITVISFFLAVKIYEKREFYSSKIRAPPSAPI